MLAQVTKKKDDDFEITKKHDISHSRASSASNLEFFESQNVPPSPQDLWPQTPFCKITRHQRALFQQVMHFFGEENEAAEGISNIYNLSWAYDILIHLFLSASSIDHRSTTESTNAKRNIDDAAALLTIMSFRANICRLLMLTCMTLLLQRNQNGSSPLSTNASESWITILKNTMERSQVLLRFLSFEINQVRGGKAVDNEIPLLLQNVDFETINVDEILAVIESADDDECYPYHDDNEASSLLCQSLADLSVVVTQNKIQETVEQEQEEEEDEDIGFVMMDPSKMLMEETFLLDIALPTQSQPTSDVSKSFAASGAKKKKLSRRKRQQQQKEMMDQFIANKNSGNGNNLNSDNYDFKHENFNFFSCNRSTRHFSNVASSITRLTNPSSLTLKGWLYMKPQIFNDPPQSQSQPLQTQTHHPSDIYLPTDKTQGQEWERVFCSLYQSGIFSIEKKSFSHKNQQIYSPDEKSSSSSNGNTDDEKEYSWKHYFAIKPCCCDTITSSVLPPSTKCSTKNSCCCIVAQPIIDPMTMTFSFEINYVHHLSTALVPSEHHRQQHRHLDYTQQHNDWQYQTSKIVMRVDDQVDGLSEGFKWVTCINKITEDVIKIRGVLQKEIRLLWSDDEYRMAANKSTSSPSIGNDR